ncbi:hypothetical protein MACK_000051 [Theileria orientalis]|uniref:Uncharacterized protein n=1 Tax=Theileria orientalis TaxID=68886 RepID=A0A976QWD1_THEOR|nr:hypothetical protein MACK_000051 [Theileria orientalis]
MKLYNYIIVIIFSNVFNIYSDPNLTKRDKAVDDLDLTENDGEEDEKLESDSEKNRSKLCVNYSKSDKPTNKTPSGPELGSDGKPNSTTKCDKKPDTGEDNRKPDDDCDQDRPKIAEDVTVIPDETVFVNPNEEVREVDEDSTGEKIDVKYVADVEEDENTFLAYGIMMTFLVSFSIVILF